MSTQGSAVLRHGDSGARERIEAAAQGSWIALFTAERNAEKWKQPLDIRCVRSGRTDHARRIHPVARASPTKASAACV